MRRPSDGRASVSIRRSSTPTRSPDSQRASGPWARIAAQGARLDVQAQGGRESGAPQEPQRILVEPLVGVAHGAQHPRVEVLDAAQRIDQGGDLGSRAWLNRQAGPSRWR